MSLRPRLGFCAALVLVLAACGAQAETPSAPPTSASGSAEAEATESPEAEATPQPPSEFAGAWIDVTAEAIGETAEWTNKVELADLDGDGWVDILFANGGNYDSPGELVASMAYLNNGDGTFTDTTSAILGDHALLTRVIRVADLNADGFTDIVLGTTYDTQSRLLLNHGAGHWADVTETQLPTAELSAGDLKLGDLDGDRDLDMVIADWGDEGPLNEGGIVNLWLNDGAAGFVDVTAERMPNTRIGFSWDLELVDVDNDWDLDVATSCKLCDGSYLFIDGIGTFTDETADRMPAFPNNYEFAPIDLDADGFLDLVTINDGAPTARGLAEHVFRNDGTGTFIDMTDSWWGPDANPGWDDNGVFALDVESDGDVDFLIGSLDGPDRLLINDGSGVLSLADDVFDTPEPSRGSLGMALADLNGDGIIDVVEAQGEVPGHHDERVYFGNPDVLAPDTAPPIIRAAVVGSSVLARVHDNRAAYAPHDWRSIVVRSPAGDVPMTWYGENLFWADLPAGAADLAVCATDAAGNEACAAL
jgi:hypothetical protein